MKIGLNCLGYECVEHLDKVLAPWLEFRKENEVLISVSHGVFPETAKLGFGVRSTDGTVEKFCQYIDNDIFNYFFMADAPMFEKDLRNKSLQYLLDEKCDLIILLDLQDEVWTVDLIKKALGFVERNKFVDWFSVNYKNYVFDDKTFINDFVAPRIWRTNRNGGIKEFYYDNDILFNNGKRASECSNLTIPRNLCFVPHLSWVGSKEYLKRKINFQNIHYGHSSYKWNEEKNCLEFNKEYYLKHSKEIPELFKD